MAANVVAAEAAVERAPMPDATAAALGSSSALSTPPPLPQLQIVAAAASNGDCGVVGKGECDLPESIRLCGEGGALRRD